jgi:hypothetical protein
VPILRSSGRILPGLCLISRARARSAQFRSRSAQFSCSLFSQYACSVLSQCRSRSSRSPFSLSAVLALVFAVRCSRCPQARARSPQGLRLISGVLTVGPPPRRAPAAVVGRHGRRPDRTSAPAFAIRLRYQSRTSRRVPFGDRPARHLFWTFRRFRARSGESPRATGGFYPEGAAMGWPGMAKL